ncbi:MAG: sigma 54-interacting transcriptional regulator [Desulfitobacterium sp.]|nr:sigma 54-interacting transcriptional regulator [Desulfitobacterium sp.]
MLIDSVNESIFFDQEEKPLYRGGIYDQMYSDIKESWMRSLEKGIDPQKPQFNIIPMDELRTIKQKSSLIKNTRSFLKYFSKFVLGPDFILFICDESGLVLEQFGEHNMTLKAEKAFKIPGCLWNEESMGCNAIAISLKTGRVSQIAKSQHYLEISKSWSGTCVPIFDNRNCLAGVIGITSDKQEPHPMHLGMLYAAAKEIGSTIQGKSKQFIADTYAVPKIKKSENGLYTFENIISRSPKMEEVIRQAKHAAKMGANVLVTGESGTGKELISQSIHSYSSRHNNSFVTVNCAAIPQELASSELFGYEAGAFTGARRNGAMGKFEQANGGTIFLDEIGDMPLVQQPILLRVLEDKKVVRLGGGTPRPVDVRVICATNQDLETLVKEKKFRGDLFYRLNVININIPPLRERPEDIIALTEFFITKFNQQLGMNIKFSEEALETMREYHWPGNIRELKNAIQKIFFMTEDEVITCEHLSFLGKKSNQSYDDTDSLSLVEMEKRYIKEALRRTNGDVTEAAKLLEMSKTTLYRRLKTIDI